MKKLTITIPLPEVPRLLNSAWSYVLAAFLLAPSYFWIAEDHRVWPWDQAWYGEVSVNAWYWLNHSLYWWVLTAADELNLKPPAIVWIGQFFVPLKHLFGSVEVSLLVFIVLTQFVLLLIIYRMGLIISPESRLPAAIAVLFASGAQLFVGLSHQFFVEPLQAVAVAWAFLIVLRAGEWSKSRILLHLAANLAFGLLVKASTPAYCWLPWLYCLYVMLRKPDSVSFFAEWNSRSFRAFAVLTGSSILLCVVWYVRHLADVWRHVRESSSGDVALDYGTRDTPIHKLGVWLPIVERSFFSPFLGSACLIALLVAAVYVARRRSVQVKQGLRLPPIAIIAAVQIVALLVLFSINIAVDPRYVYAMLPCLAVLFIKICAALPRSASIAMLVFCGFHWFVVNRASFAAGIKLENQSEWLFEPHYDGTDLDELARAVHLTSTLPGRYNIVAIESPRLNANSAAFFAAKDRLTTGVLSYYTSIGYAQKDPDAALRRIEEFRAPYVLTLAADFQDPSPNFLNVAVRPVLERMEHDQRFARVPFKSKEGVLVFAFHADPASSASTDAHAVLPQSDLTRIPPEIARAKIQKRGKSSLGWINAALAKQEANEHLFWVSGGTIASCDGWAFDDLLKSTPEDVWLELTNSQTGQRYYWPAHRYNRPELAEAEKIPSIKRSGFNCQPVNFALPAGVYTTKVYQVDDGGKAIVSDLNTYEPSPKLVVR